MMKIEQTPFEFGSCCSTGLTCSSWAASEPEKPTKGTKDRVSVNRKSLDAMLQRYQLALDQLAYGCGYDEDGDAYDKLSTHEKYKLSGPSSCNTGTAESKFCSLLESRLESDDSIKKIENSQAPLATGSSWDIVCISDLWEGGDFEFETEDYVLAGQEDIKEGIAAFMAAYLLSLEQTKDLGPNQLEEALQKTFATKRKKGKLWKAWDASKVVYKAASWGATAVGIYQNFDTASAAFWTSYHIISKLL